MKYTIVPKCGKSKDEHEILYNSWEIFLFGGSYLGVLESALEAVWSEVVPKEKLKVNQAQKVGEIIPGYQNVLTMEQTCSIKEYSGTMDF